VVVVVEWVLVALATITAMTAPATAAPMSGSRRLMRVMVQWLLMGSGVVRVHAVQQDPMRNPSEIGERRVRAA
jgi:hypothetical protein